MCEAPIPQESAPHRRRIHSGSTPDRRRSPGVRPQIDPGAATCRPGIDLRSTRFQIDPGSTMGRPRNSNTILDRPRMSPGTPESTRSDPNRLDTPRIHPGSTLGSTPNRTQKATNPGSPNIDPKSSPERPRVDLGSTTARLNADRISTLHWAQDRARIDTGSSKFRHLPVAPDISTDTRIRHRPLCMLLGVRE